MTTQASRAAWVAPPTPAARQPRLFAGDNGYGCSDFPLSLA
jgi:hypothetical protein